MSGYDFFLSLMSLCGQYINRLVNLIFAVPAVSIPLIIVFCVGVFYMIMKFFKE